MRIADLKPDFGTAPRHPNRPREALDASPHPSGSQRQAVLCRVNGSFAPPAGTRARAPATLPYSLLHKASLFSNISAQYCVTERCTCMLTCGDASVADGDAENKDKARDLVDLVSSSNEKYARRSRASSFLFFFPPRAESGPGSSPPPPPFPVRPPRGSRTPRGNGGPQSGFVGQNLVFWIIAFPSGKNAGLRPPNPPGWLL